MTTSLESTKDRPEIAQKRLTVLQVLPDLEGGGVESCVLGLANFLVRQGHTSLVASGGGRLVSRLIAGGSQHFTMSLGRKSPCSVRYIPILRRLIAKTGVDIIHLHSRMPAWITYLAWISLPSAQRPRLITTFHGFYSVNMYSAIMTKGETVIAVSQAIAEHIKKNYHLSHNKKIKVIYNGVDCKMFTPEAVNDYRINLLRKKWRHWGDEPIIMLPGRLTKLKGQDIFLQSLAQITDLPWSAICVGDTTENPRYTKELKELCSFLSLDHRVFFAGHCDDMPATLSLADLVVSASSSQAEAFGLISIEAAAMGKAVIASAHGGSLETVVDGKSGWLFPPNNPNELAKALRQALNSPHLRHKYGLYGQSIARSKFSLNKNLQNTLSTYYNLLATK